MRFFLSVLLLATTACQASLIQGGAGLPVYQTYTGDRLLDGFGEGDRATEDRLIRELFNLPIGVKETVDGYEVEVERAYQAASGYECRRIRLKAGAAGGMEARRLACRKGDQLAVVNRI